jgi:hypothetical protein
VTVKTPDCGSLTPEDMVLIMPVKSIAYEIAVQIKKSGCLAVFSQELVRYVSFDEFPQFYDGSLRYNPDANDR